MKIVFMGTPDFAATCLESLANSEHDVVGLICQPDKPVGRKRELRAPDTKITAQKHGIPVFQPESLRNGRGLEILKTLRPDICVVVAYGKLLPDDVLSFPKYGCINVHASLLPKYRGASPIHAAVLNGDEETGVTVMQMDSGLDTGDILLTKKEKIDINDTTERMYEKLAPVASEALIECLELIRDNKVIPVPQDDCIATKVGLLSKEMSPIDFSMTAFEVHNHIRGLYSWPCASTFLDGRVLKILSSQLSDKTFSGVPGQVFIIQNDMFILCGDNKAIQILSLQLEGKKRMEVRDFLNGYKIEEGLILPDKR